MEHFTLRCKHCKKEYIYCTYGNGHEYGTEEGCSKEYCSECQKAIDNALKSIPIKFKPIKEKIIDEKEKQKIIQELESIKSEAEKKDCFHVVSLVNSKFDNVDRYTYDGKTYYVEYNDENPNDKYLSIEVEYDIINEKSTSKAWRTTTNSTFQHGRSFGSTFNVTTQELDMPKGSVFGQDFLNVKKD